MSSGENPDSLGTLKVQKDRLPTQKEWLNNIRLSFTIFKRRITKFGAGIESLKSKLKILAVLYYLTDSSRHM